MGILVVAVLATCVGFVLILLIGRNQPVSPASPQFAGLEVATTAAQRRGRLVVPVQKAAAARDLQQVGSHDAAGPWR